MLKTLFLLAVAAGALWWWRGRGHDLEKKAAQADNQATRYVSALQGDVKKAEEAQKKADEAVRQEADAAKKGLEDAEGRSR